MTIARQHALTLPANARAVGLARVWVGQVLHELGRDDLADSAELGVSELVTNAIIHSTPPVAVRVRGTRAHPRIEVADRSTVPPQPNPLRPTDDDDLLSTYGRGLALVAVHSAAWGADLDVDGHGKTVWFEPVTEPDPADLSIGDLFDIEELMAEQVGAQPASETVEIRLLGAPVTAVLDLLRYYGELRRELRLVALTNPDRYPLAVRFSEVAMRAEQERRQTTGVQPELSDAEQARLECVDLVCRVPITAPQTMRTLKALLVEVYAFLDEETLLVAHPTDRQLQIQDWYLAQYDEQGAGAAPRSWTGGYSDHRQHAAT